VIELVAKVQVETDFDGVYAYLKGAPQREAEVQRLWKEQGSHETQNFMRCVVPVKTGFLRESIVTKANTDGFTVFPTASYANFVDQGTKPHAIFPREARVLRWYGPSGAPVFSKFAQHPGTRGVFFVQQTGEAMLEVLRQLYVMIWREKDA
jgi:hypothetical protein